ncbi:MAG: NAD(P)/FAD-dependent oxidoreductase [Bacteroidota bacterium]
MDLGIQVSDLCRQMSYDVAIIGGGLAGLALANDLAIRGRRVIVFEKGEYPRHKVCGEYISMESHEYLLQLCPQIGLLNLPAIKNFLLTSTGRSEYKTRLDLGGFGISRYLLEKLLYKKAEEAGVQIVLNTKVSEVITSSENEKLVRTTSGNYIARLVCNASGRKSNFEAKENVRKHNRINYVGVKYHIKTERDPEQIEIHNFPGGYCGVSDIEDGKSCLCYIVNSEKLIQAGNSIPEMEKMFLFRNESLRKIFDSSSFLFKTPVTISGINFNIKQSVNDGIFYLGDSAGSISPITGNGMSMALRSSFILAGEMEKFFSGNLTIGELNSNYRKFWSNEFENRIKFSRYLQKLSEFPVLTKGVIALFRNSSLLANKVISTTHGKPF